MDVSPGHTRTPPHNADGLALVAGPRCQGEEPSPRHRVGPWSPVIPVQVVPALVGGDTPTAGTALERGGGGGGAGRIRLTAITQMIDGAAVITPAVP